MVKDTVRYAGLVSLESCDFPWWLSFLPWRKLPPLPPHGLQVALHMEVVSFALRHQYEPSWSRCLSFSHSSPLIYLSVSVSLSVSVCLFTNQSCDLSLNISNNSLSLVSVFGSLSLSVTLTVTVLLLLTPHPHLHSFNGAMVPTVVQLWYLHAVQNCDFPLLRRMCHF